MGSHRLHILRVCRFLAERVWNGGTSKVDVNRKRGTPLRFCIKCSDTMIAATSSKYVSERSIRNSWSCDACGFGFGTAASALRSGEQVKSSGNAMVRRQITARPLFHPAIAKWCSSLACAHTLMSCRGCPTNNRAEQAYCCRRVRMGYRVHYQDRVDRSEA